MFFSEMITSERYHEYITYFISLLKGDEQGCWLQQEGATAHTANSTM
jgi:hypothetical protein